MPLATKDIQFLRELISDRTGNVVTAQQSYLFDVKLQEIAEDEGFESVESLVASIRESAPHRLYRRIAQAMTINETFFFRDETPFQALRYQILPKLIHSRQKERKLRLWAAACSTGQEAYSMAITIREYFPELDDWDIVIRATDLCEAVLERAQLGEYTEFEVQRGLPPKLLENHFEHVDETWRVNDRIKEMLQFRPLNLIKPWPMFEPADILFLRNVLIYFDIPTRETILRNTHSVMSEDGYLILGGGESILRLDAPFVRDEGSQFVFFRPVH